MAAIISPTCSKIKVPVAYCCISITQTASLVRMANTHDHELRPSDYKQLVISSPASTEAPSTSRRLIGPDTGER